MGESHMVSHIVYRGREDMGNGRVSRFEAYISNNAEDWRSPAVAGWLQNTAGEQVMALDKATEGRYLRFVILSTHDRQGYGSVAELSIRRNIPAEE